MGNGDDPRIGWPAWIGVVADDLDAQTAFYRDVLGMREADRSEEWVQLDLDGHKFEILAKTQDPQYDRRRVQIGFRVDDIRAAVDALVERGVERISEIEHDEVSGSSWCYFRDPEGNVFEITQIAPDDGAS